jgi:hypothetical protein
MGLFWIGGMASISEGLLAGWGLGVCSMVGVAVGVGLPGFFLEAFDLAGAFLTVFFFDVLRVLVFLDAAEALRWVRFEEADFLAAALAFFFDDLEVAGEGFFFLFFLAMV